MKTVWARLGQPAILPCDLAPDGRGRNEEAATNLLLEWRKNGTLIFNAFGQEPGYCSPEFQGRLARARRLGLTFHSVRAEDQNLYRCSITRFSTKGTAGEDKEHGGILRMVVHSFPRITEPADGSEYFVRQNGTASLECLAEGMPSPNVRWKRRMGSRLVAVHEGNLLRLTNFSAEHEGDFVCEAENFEGTTQAVLKLRTRKPLRIDRQNASFANKTAVEGASVFWHCSVEAPHGRVQIKWSRNGEPISESAVGLRAHLKDGEFGILRLRREDSGPYVCEATSSGEEVKDEFFEHDRFAVHLDVQYKPEVLIAKTRRFHTLVSGSVADLDCLFSANPVPSIVKWTKNGRELNGHQERVSRDGLMASRVHISSASLPADAGIYTCEAENSVGASPPFEVHVVVADAPKFTKMPAPVYRVEAGHSLEVQCEGFAEVPLRRTWTKNGVPFELPDSKFVLKSVSHDDHGIYRCILVNSIVSVFREFQIRVENTRPQCVGHVRVECQGQRGFSLSWMPGYAGQNFTQLFRLFYKKSTGTSDDETVENGEEKEGHWQVTDFTNHARLRVENLEDFGEYKMKLEAGNKFGQVNCSVPGQHPTCSRLSPPTNFRLELIDGEPTKRPILLWDEVPEAQKYKVKYRHQSQGKDAAFRELTELRGNKLVVPVQRLHPNGSSPPVELVIQAIRPPFLSSDLSKAIHFPPASTQTSAAALTLGLISIGALMAALFFLLLIIFVKKHAKGRRNIFIEEDQQHMKAHQGRNGLASCEVNCIDKRNFNVNCNSSHCPSSSSLTSRQPQQQCIFGNSVAITRKLFPDNYICTRLAEFDEDEEQQQEAGEGESYEHYGQFSSCENTFLGVCNGSSVSANFMEMQSEPVNWPAARVNGKMASKSNSYMEMKSTADLDEQRSAVDEMLRDKYIFAQSEELDRIDERRIQELRRELMERCGNDTTP